MDIPAISQVQGKTIFIAPLDWGLGHASRCVAIIHELRNKNQILIGCSSDHEKYFKIQFPDIPLILLPSSKVHYSRRGPAWLSMVFQLPHLIGVIRRENRILKQIITKHNIDLVISDNRYGLYHPGTACVFVSHQLNLKVPVFSGLLNRLHRRQIENFTEVWVPDFEERTKRLAGELSANSKLNVPIKYIGPLSALSQFQNLNSSLHCDILILLSGPEPQRSLLEELLFRKLSGSAKKITMIRGSEIPQAYQTSSIKIVDTLFGTELAQCIKGADLIVCRSGYSTLMDLHGLGKNNILLIPTPGQPEQEYLANYWSENFSAKICRQNKLMDVQF